MRFSNRSKVNIFVSLLTIMSGFMLNGLFSREVPAYAASTPQYSVTKGVLTPSTTVDSTQQPVTIFPKVARPTKPMGSSQGAHVSEAGALTLNPGALLNNFNGVSSRDSAKTNFGAEFEPPDQGLCAGNGFVVEPVNSAYTIYHRDGSVVAGPFNVNRLFKEGFKQFTSDPRCYFDQPTHTWFAIILFINSTNTRARTDLAVNPSGDPTTPWTVYHIDATDDGTNGTPKHPGCPCLGDQPLLGIDQFNVYISTNEFPIVGPGFNGAQIYAISKSQLVALSKSVDFVHFDKLSIGGAIAASVQPAISNGTPKAEYFMNSLDPNGTFDNRLGVWAITARDVVSKGGIPNLSNVVITSEPYSIPPGAKQMGAKSLLDSGDDRMQQVQFINGSLWGALGTAVTIPHDPASRAGVAWFNVMPHLDGKVIGGANINNEGYVTLKGNYLLYPAIQASSAGTATMVMTLSGSNFFPSAVYTVMQQGQKSFGAVHVAAPGISNYFPKSTRWGDYSAAVLDPDGNSFWMATEYIPPKSSQTRDGHQNWGTRVLQVSAIS